MDKILFDELSKKIDKIIEKYDFIKKENLKRKIYYLKKKKSILKLKNS